MHANYSGTVFVFVVNFYRKCTQRYFKKDMKSRPTVVYIILVQLCRILISFINFFQLLSNHKLVQLAKDSWSSLLVAKQNTTALS
jgi:hypothetical protein